MKLLTIINESEDGSRYKLKLNYLTPITAAIL